MRARGRHDHLHRLANLTTLEVEYLFEKGVVDLEVAIHEQRPRARIEELRQAGENALAAAAVGTPYVMGPGRSTPAGRKDAPRTAFMRHRCSTHQPSTRCTVATSCSGLKGLTSQPVAPAALPSIFFSGVDSVVSISSGVNL